MPADPNILKAARILLGLSQERLAKDAGVSTKSLSRVEAGSGDTMLSTVDAVKAALESHGVVFLGGTEALGPGLRVPAELAFAWEEERARVARERDRVPPGAPRGQA